MKEETPLLPQLQQPSIYRAQIRTIQPTNPPSERPCARFKHQTFIYRGKLYLHGGTTIPVPDFGDDPLDLFSFGFEGDAAGKWQKLRTRVSGGKEMQAVSAHAAVLNGSKWYIFGGSNNDFKPNNMLLRLNMEQLEWTCLQQKGEIPPARECAHLSFIEKNWLVLYGGFSTSEVDVYNTFHFYKLDTRNWSNCEGAYQFQIYPRMDPAICQFNDRIYLFGGTYRSLNSNQERHLDDFYEMAVTAPGRNLAGRVQVKRISASRVPQGRSGHSLVGVGQHHLLMLGGENTCSQLREAARFEDVALVENMWLFDTRTAVWGKIHLPDPCFPYRTMTSCLTHNNKLYLFGGLHSYTSVLKDLVEISIDPQQLSQPKRRALACPECQQRQRFPPSQRHIAASIIQDIADGIDFPFAAVGLLIDNSMNSGASLLKISYFHGYGPQNMRLIKFEDDAKLNWTDEELLETLAHFNAGQMHAPSGTDKKIKAGLMKDAFRREYGYNLKVASLRLGEGFLFISYHQQNSLYRVCLFEKEDRDTPQQRYTLQFYVYNIFQRKVVSPQMQKLRQRISDKFGDLVQSVFYQRKCRNTLLVLSPRIQDSKRAIEAGEGEELQLKADIDNSNILNGPILKIRQLERAGLFVQECVDVSLRAYITCLYLKNECMKILLSVRQAVIQPIQVQTQSFLEKVDRLCKHKHVLQINPALQFDLKINQLYYLYDLRKKLSFFNNGLLIYHKNRLLMRYKYPLGELLQRKYYKRPLCHNFLRLFGFIELPDHIPVNFLKTNYLHHAMMERLFSRLKLISKLFKRQLQKMAADPDYRRPAPTRLNELQMQQEKNQISEPKQTRRKSESAPRELSLRRTKTPQKDWLEGRLKQLLKDPTSQNIKEIIKLVETNSGSKEQLDYFHKNKYRLLGPLAPIGRPLSNRSAQIQKMRQAARMQAQALQKGELNRQNMQLKGNAQQGKQQMNQIPAQEMQIEQNNEQLMMNELQERHIMMQQANSSSSDEESEGEGIEMAQKQTSLQK